MWVCYVPDATFLWDPQRTRAPRNVEGYKNYSENALQSAIDAVINGTYNIAAAAKHFGVPRTTLSRRAAAAKDTPSCISE